MLSAIEAKRLQKLPAFTGLADRAVDALREAFTIATRHQSERPTLDDVAPAMKLLKSLKGRCRAWHGDGTWSRVDAFAAGINKTVSDAETLRQLVTFHETEASGLVWLRLRGDVLERAVHHKSPPGSDYRFRLHALANLGRGCGIIAAAAGGGARTARALQEDDGDD